VPLKCFNKPLRRFARHFSARDVGRIACTAVEQGVAPADIRTAMQDCVPCDQDENNKRLLDRAMEALAESQQQLAIVITLVGALVAAIAAVQLVGRFVPQARLALLVLRPAFSRVEGFLVTLIARKAANDAVIAILRRAA